MSPPRILLTRYALATVCLVLTFVSLTTFFSEERRRGELIDVLNEAGLADTAERVRYERTVHHAEVLTARGLLHTVLDARDEASATSGADSTIRGTAADRLPRVAELARRVLVAQPNSWEGAMLLGSAIYLERSILRDPQLYTAYPDWEAPLEKALREAPSKAEPRRFLAGAYLEVWPALSPEKKAAATSLLRRAFASDPLAFSTLLPTWLDLSSDQEETFAVIPDKSKAWSTLERHFAKAKDWPTFCRAHGRRLEALLMENEQNLSEAEQRLRLGELYHSRSLLLQIVATSPLDPRFAPTVSRALELYPPGLHGLASTEPLRNWLRWAMDLHLYGKNPLPNQVTSRLSAAAGELEPHEKALAALIGGEVHHAEQQEILVDSLKQENWGPYLIAKARWYLSRGQTGEAAAILKMADNATRRSPIYILARQEVARAQGNLVELATAEHALDELRSRQWSATQWRWRGYQASLALLPKGPAAGIRLALNKVPDDGAVVEIDWDGKALAFEPITEDGELELRFPIDDNLHVLELRMVAGIQLYPGRVHLLDIPP